MLVSGDLGDFKGQNDYPGKQIFASQSSGNPRVTPFSVFPYNARQRNCQTGAFQRFRPEAGKAKHLPSIYKRGD